MEPFEMNDMKTGTIIVEKKMQAIEFVNPTFRDQVEREANHESYMCHIEYCSDVSSQRYVCTDKREKNNSRL